MLVCEYKVKVHETARLQSDLARAGTTPYGWIVNQSFAATDTRDPILSKRAGIEVRYINEVKKLSKRLYLLPWQPDAPVGVKRYRSWSKPARIQ